MLKLRLKRVGRKHDPSFRVVVTEITAPPKGKYVEAVGFYNARLKQLKLDSERIQYWLSVGVQPSDTVHNLLVQEGILSAPKKAVHSRKPSKKKAAKPREAAQATKEEIKEGMKEEVSSAEMTQPMEIEVKEPVTVEAEESQAKQEKEEPLEEKELKTQPSEVLSEEISAPEAVEAEEKTDE